MSFRFAIGEFVTFKNAAAECATVDWLRREDRRPNVFMILERWTSECHGGTQYMYTLRGNMMDRIASVCDFELKSYEPKESAK